MMPYPLYSRITESLIKDAAVRCRIKFFYQDGDRERVLSEKNNDSLPIVYDPESFWIPEKHGMTLKVDLDIEYSEFFYSSEGAVARDGAEIGICLIW